MEPLEVDFEAPGLPAFPLPAELARLYGGSFGLHEPRVFANFVQSIDGVTAIPSLAGSNKLIAAGSTADRFVMGLLRAAADVVIVGSGTLQASPRGAWTPAQAFPEAADAYAELRARIGRTGDPEVIVLTRSGLVDAGHPAFGTGAIALTTPPGVEALATLPPGQVVIAGDELDATTVVAALRRRGHVLILSEGGPTAWGPLLAAGLVDELFLTVSPLLTGRVAGDLRLSLVESTDLLEGGPLAAHLLGIRRGGDHLFLRYRFDTGARGSLDGTTRGAT
jgi:riboflavin biosynthesis pyrimidine reductase